MARSNTTEGQALWQPGGAEEDSHCEGDRHLRLEYDKEEEEARATYQISSLKITINRH